MILTHQSIIMLNMSTIDSKSKQILDILKKDPRTPNNAIARKVGIVEATVANRLRQMRDENVMCVVLRRDFHYAGFDFQAYIDVSVSGRTVDGVAKDLAKIDAVKAVSITLGKPEIVLVINCKDRHELTRILNIDIAATRGISAIETHTVLNIRKSKMGHGNLKV